MMREDEWIDPVTGLTGREKAVMDRLVLAQNDYQSLPRQHPSEPQDFADAIHLCQQLLALRVARRQYPEGWPTL